MFENHVGGNHTVERRNISERIAQHAGARAVYDDDDLAVALAMNLDIVERRKRCEHGVPHLRHHRHHGA